MNLSRSSSRSYPHEISIETPCMVFIDNTLLINMFSFKVGFLPTIENKTLTNIALEKIEMFFDLFVQNSIIIEKNNHQDFKNLIKIDNNIIMCPDVPNDQTVGSLFYCKLLSIVGDDLSIEYLTLSSELGRNILYTFCEDSIELELLVLAHKAGAWWNDDSVNFLPWWHRADTATYDLLIDKEKYYQGDISWEEFFKDEIERLKQNQKTAKGKLKIITGGKDEIK